MEKSQVIHEIDPRAWIVGDGKRELTPNRTRIESGVWRPKFLPTPERQGGNGGDSLSCTSQSLCNVLEMQLQFDYNLGILSKEFKSFLEVEGYLDSNGKINFDDQKLAYESGTTKRGNSLDKVLATACSTGLSPAKFYDWDKFTWDSYYTKPSQKQIDVGLKFLTFVDMSYWWLFLGSSGSAPDAIATLQHHLRDAPLWLADMYHAKTITEARANGILGIFDTYNPYDREQSLASQSAFWVKKVIITEKNRKKLPPYLPYYEKVEGQSVIAAFDVDTFEMVPFDSGKVFKMVAGEYGKAVKRTKEQGWSYPLAQNRHITIT